MKSLGQTARTGFPSLPYPVSATLRQNFHSFPVLSGMKARQIRYLVPAVLNICKDEDSADEPYTLHRTAVLESLELMYQLIDSGVMHFSSKQSQQYRKATDRLLQHYTKCCKMCMELNFYQWNLVHKHHLAAHMPDQADFINPKYLTTYAGETMVGFISSLSHACLNGTAPHLVPNKVCWRFRLALWLRLSGSDFEGTEE